MTIKLILNIIITILLIINLGVLIAGIYLDNETLIYIGLFSSLFIYGKSLLIRVLMEDNDERI